MPTYVVLYRFSDHGLKSVKDTVKRAAEIRRQNEQRGFKVVGTYWTQGRFDLIAIVEAPDEQSMVAGLLNIAEAGNVHSETMRAFTDAEMDTILKRS